MNNGNRTRRRTTVPMRFANYVMNNTGVQNPITTATPTPVAAHRRSPAAPRRTTTTNRMLPRTKRTMRKKNTGSKLNIPFNRNYIWNNANNRNGNGSFFGERLTRNFLNAIGLDHAPHTDVYFVMQSPTYAIIYDTQSQEPIGFHHTDDISLRSEIAAIDPYLLEMLDTLNPILESTYHYPNKTLHLPTMQLS